MHGRRGLDLFVCGDQLLRGAALNAVLIAEAMLAQRRAGKGGAGAAAARGAARRRILGSLAVFGAGAAIMAAMRS